MKRKGERTRGRPLSFVLALLLALWPMVPAAAAESGAALAVGTSASAVEVSNYDQLWDALLDGASRVQMTDDIIPMTDDSLLLRKALELDLNGYQFGSSSYRLDLFANGKALILADSRGTGSCYANLYGAGDKMGPTFNTSITVKGGRVYGNIYGGGVTGSVNSASVVIAGGSIAGNIYGGSEKGPVTDPDITVSGGSIGGSVSGDVGTITFLNYGSEDSWAELPVIENAKDVVLDHSYVKVTDENAPFGEAESQVKNLTVPSGSGISVPNGGAIAGDFSGGGTLVLSGGAFEVGGTVTEQTTVVIEADQPVKGMEYIKTESTAGGIDAFVPANPDWSFGGEGSWVLDGDEYTVEFDANGGDGIYASVTALSGSRIPRPEPDPTREAFTFEGWYRSQDNGATLGDAFQFSLDRVYENQTLYAGWKEVPPPDPEDPDTTGGGITGGGVEPGDSGSHSGSGGHRKPATESAGTTGPAAGLSEGGITSESAVSGPAVTPGAIDHFAYLRGDVEGLFRPDDPLTRAEAAVLFAGIDPEYRPGMAGSLSLADVEPGQWYADAVYYNVSQDIIAGLPDGTFGPGRSVTRAEFAALTGRFLGLQNSGGSSFSDVKDNWAEGYIARLSSQGILRGYPDGSFHPEWPVSRAEAACALNTVLDRRPDHAQTKANAGKYSYDLRDVPPQHWAYVEILEAAVDHNSEDFHR